MDIILEFNSRDDWVEFISLYNQHKSEDLFFFKGQPVMPKFAKFLIDRYNEMERINNAHFN